MLHFFQYCRLDSTRLARIHSVCVCAAVFFFFFFPSLPKFQKFSFHCRPTNKRPAAELPAIALSRAKGDKREREKNEK